MHGLRSLQRLIALVVLGAVLVLIGGCGTRATPPASKPPGGVSVSTSTVQVAASTPVGTKLTPFGTLSDGSRIVLLAWNDLGMHCYNADFSKFAVLPPYNNLHAQVVRVGGEEPRVITKGISVEYRFPQNTYAVGQAGEPDKSNFWTYAKAEFGADLQPNIGLTGKGLSGVMDVTGNQFVAEGIPLTDILDKDAGTSTIYPYQQALVTVRDSTGKEIAGLVVVAPVSTEMRCDKCHGDAGVATTKSGTKPTGDYYANIIATHDTLSAAAYSKLGMKPLATRTEPFLCAECHSSNALKAAGVAGVSSLSNAMHRRHSTAGIPATTEGCQNCHPGPETKCLRDVHVTELKYGCPDCHGDLGKVATNPAPWLNEPRCDSPACHKKTTVADIGQNAALYRASRGMGGLACEACHDSTHALAKSREVNDNLKFLALQGDATYLKKCSICHGTERPEGNTKVHQPEG